MALTWVWVGMVCVALIYGAATGQSAAVGAAAAQGVQQAVTFCLTVGGMICLWSGVMEVMRRSGIAAGLSRLLQPVLRRLFPRASRDAQTLDALSMNVSANLLGLGNAATPAGVRAAQAMARELRGSSWKNCRLLPKTKRKPEAPGRYRRKPAMQSRKRRSS